MLATAGNALQQNPILEPEFTLATTAEFELARRIVASRGFRRSELLQRFLLEVCELALTGRAEEINEQRIGTRAFGRPQGYDPGEDNIVRNYARMLRRRLDTYYEEEGAGETIRITIPRGGYIPVFNYVQKDAGNKLTLPSAQADVVEIPGPVAVPNLRSNRSTAATHWRSIALGVVVGLMFGLGAWMFSVLLNARQTRTPAHALWVKLFDKNHNTFIVTADSGLGILENLTHTQASLEDYLDGSYFAHLMMPHWLDAANFDKLSQQHYTSAVALGICSEFERLPEFTPNRTQIRYARSITAEEIRKSNIILLGSSRTNPWITLFESRLNFEISHPPNSNRSLVINHHPLKDEPAVYGDPPTSNQKRTYGTIAYLPSVGSTGDVLIVQGLNMAATRAAADILFNSATMESVLSQAATPDGQLKAFELLVETTSIGASTPNAHILAMRAYPGAGVFPGAH